MIGHLGIIKYKAWDRKGRILGTNMSFAWRKWFPTLSMWCPAIHLGDCMTLRSILWQSWFTNCENNSLSLWTSFSKRNNVQAWYSCEAFSSTTCKQMTSNINKWNSNNVFGYHICFFIAIRTTLYISRMQIGWYIKISRILNQAAREMVTEVLRECISFLFSSVSADTMQHPKQFE